MSRNYRVSVDTEAGEYVYEVSAQDEERAKTKALKVHTAPNMPAAWGVRSVEEVK